MTSDEHTDAHPELRIVAGGLDDPAVIKLLGEHLAHMREHSPPESVHALDAGGLGAAEVSFWSVWQGDELVGCGALKELDADHGEIKSMRTDNRHLGKGVGRRLLEHIIETARQRGYRRLSLETGSGPAFEAAHRLYLRHGFDYCAPFSTYREDPFSRFMTRQI